MVIANAQRTTFANSEEFLRWLFQVSNAGIQITGDTGCGKSNTMELIAQGLAKAGQPFILIDPHGLLSDNVERFCSQEQFRRRGRFLTIQPSDTRHIIGINPLSVPRDGCDEFTWNCRLTAKVRHVSRILLAAWGETNFNKTPRMYTWITRILKTLGACGLPFAEARHFLDVGSSVYQRLVQLVPDSMARYAFENLATGRRPAEIDEQIESTRSRFLGFLDNRIIDAMLGRVQDVLDMREVIEDGVSLIINLHPGTELGEEDQQILANLFLSEVIYTVMSMPKERRRPLWLLIDELPVFASSGPLLEAALRQVRKFGLRIVAAHQGTTYFPEKTEDRLLNSFVSMCGVNLIMQHTNPVDAKFFGELIALPNYNVRRVKHEEWQEKQYQDGWEYAPVLYDESENQTETESHGGAISDGTNTTDTWGTDTGSSTGTTVGEQHDERLLRQIVSESRAQVSSSRSSEGGSVGRSHEERSSWTKGKTRGGSITKKQSLIPVIKTKEERQSIQFYTPEEHNLESASEVSSQPVGDALMRVSALGVARVQVPLATNPFPNMPKAAQRNVAKYREQIHQLPIYATSEAITQERDELLKALISTIDGHVLGGKKPSGEQLPKIKDEPEEHLPWSKF